MALPPDSARPQFTSLTDYRFRPMRLDDLDQVVAIDQLSFSMPWPASAYRYELLENPMSLLWVAEVVADGRPASIVGVIVVWLILDEAHIATLAVHPDYRQRGLGSRLIVEAMKDAIRKGAHSATLEVRAGNLKAQSVYRHFHYEVVGVRPRYYRDNNEDALIMTADHLDQAYLEWLESEAWLAEKTHSDSDRRA
jgi:ribosomal-protein-alanine N-acetyltransferase